VSAHILPDSRPREAKDSVRGPDGRTYVQIFCANCGVPYGRVPEEHITFAFAMCQPCADKYGDDAHFYKEPDEVFWERVRNAQLEDHGRTLSAEELTVEVADPTSALGKLASEWRKLVERTQR
jgi:hypothetical protein